MMTAGTGDEGGVTMELKQNGHPNSIGDSEDGSDKINESSNYQATTKEDKQEAAEENMDISAETRAPLENGRSSPAAAGESAPARPERAAPSSPSPRPSPVSGGGPPLTVIRKRSGEPAEDGAAKKARLEPSERATPLTPDISCLRTVELIESSLHKLKREVKAIDLLARQKEKEWDNLLKLRKAKEETFQRLRRKREVLLMQQSDEAASLAHRVAAGPPSSGAAPAATPASTAASTAASLVQAQLQQKQKQQQQQQAQQQAQQVQQQVQQQAQQQAQQVQQRAAAAAALTVQPGLGLRPIRPAFGGGRIGQGMGPQGPTISVQQLIERHHAGHAAEFRRRPELPVPLPASSPAGPQDPQYREMLAQIAKLRKTNAPVPSSTGEVTIHQVGGPSDAAAGSGQPQSSLAKLLMESKMKQVEPAMLNEMLKRRPAGPLTGGVLQAPQSQLTIRSSVPGVPRVSAPPPAPQPLRQPPPPPPAAEEVPLCQGCRQRQAQFVCAGCGHQWYCSRECQVEAWDNHADDCSG